MRCLLFILLLPAAAIAGSSADYSLTPEALDGAGLTGTGGGCRAAFSAGPGETGVSADYHLRSGFAGQLDLTSVHITVAPAIVPEGTTAQLAAALVTDSGTVTPLDPGDVSWSLLDGPLSGVSSGGLLSSEIVWLDTPATIHGSYLGITGSIMITVQNDSTDDFAPYAADGLPDDWQVQHFGLSGVFAGRNDDPDGDTADNFMEFAFGTDPGSILTGSSYVSYFGPVSGGGTLLRSGMPVIVIPPDPSGTARALFSRRGDFLSAGLHYRPQFSADLETWLDADGPPSFMAGDDLVDAVIVSAPASVRGRAAFFRVLIWTE